MYRLNFGIVRLLFENLEGISCWPRWPEHNFGNDRQQREKKCYIFTNKNENCNQGWGEYTNPEYEYEYEYFA